MTWLNLPLFTQETSISANPLEKIQTKPREQIYKNQNLTPNARYKHPANLQTEFG